MKYRYDLEISEKNKVLENNQDLAKYVNDYLFDLFNVSDFFEINENFLNNYYLYNFFLNFVKIVPQISSIFFNIDFDETFIVKDFFEFIKTKPDFESFRDYKINKKIFFKILMSININLFCVQ